MNREAAIQIVGYLCGATTGWNDEAVETYVHEIAELHDIEAAKHAVRRVIRTWSEARRPPIGVILDAYRTEAMRRSEALAALPSAHRPVPVDEGILIARAAYVEQCERDKREPNLRLFDGYVDSFTGERTRRSRSPFRRDG